MTRPSPIRFTSGMWLCWIAISAVNECLLKAVNSALLRGGLGDGDGAGAILGVGVGLVLLDAMLIPATATTQWLVLRRTRPDLSWFQWFFVSAFVAAVFAVAFGYWSLPQNGIATKIGVGIGASFLAASVTATTLQQKQRGHVSFGIVFGCFLIGSALTLFLQLYDSTGMRTDFFPSGLNLLQQARATLSRHSDVAALVPPSLIPDIWTVMFSLEFLIDVFAAALGASISGLGLWFVSRTPRVATEVWQ
jgi:hypothetical protein